MRPDQPESSIQCSYCGFVDSGKFCSNCGKELTAQRKPFLIEALPKILKLDELISHIRVFFTILRSPTKVTLELIADRTFHDHIGFLVTGVGLYILPFGYLAIVTNNPVSQQLFLSVLQGLYLALGIYITFLLLRNASSKSVAFAEYMKVVSLIWGFTMPFTGLMVVIGAFLGLDVVGRVVARFVLAIPILIYQIRVLSKYWTLSKLRVLWLWWYGGTLSLSLLLILNFVLSVFFDIEIQWLSG